MRNKGVAVVALSLIITVLAPDAGALTCPFGTFSEDTAFNTFAPSMVSGWVVVLDGVNTMVDQGSWGSGAGFGTYDITLPFTKIAAATALLSFAHWDTWVGFHPNGQYFDEGLPLASHYHNASHWSYKDENSASEASTTYYTEGITDGHTSFKCGLFGNNGGVNTTSERAATIVHESWHQVLNDHGFNPHHQNDQGACQTGLTGACDYYYPHTLLDYLPGGEAGGDLAYFRQSNGSTFTTHSLFHSPYQIGLEYVCDLGQFSKPATPLVTIQSATTIAKGRAATNFINIVSWVCGRPIPF